MAGGDFGGCDGVAFLEGGEFKVFLFAVDFEEAVEDDDFATGDEDFGWDGAGLEADGGLGDPGARHLGGEGAGADEFVKFALVIVGAGFGDLDVGGADGFVGFLGAGGFGLEVADVEVGVAVGVFDVGGHAGEGLF